jgi:fucose permease
MAIGLIGAAVGPLVVGFVNSAGGLRYLSAIVMVLVGLLLALWHLVPLTMAKVNIDQTD